jgi:hypothetical protein
VLSPKSKRGGTVARRAASPKVGKRGQNNNTFQDVTSDDDDYGAHPHVPTSPLQRSATTSPKSGRRTKKVQKPDDGNAF